jgi:hypothetical protein
MGIVDHANRSAVPDSARGAGAGLVRQSKRLARNVEPVKAAATERPARSLGDYDWNPIACIFFLLFALAEFGNWQMGNEMARVCELVGQGNALTGAAKTEVGGICSNRSPQGFYKTR